MARVKGVPSWYTGDTSNFVYRNKLDDRQAYDNNVNDFINFTKQVDGQQQNKFNSDTIANEIRNTPVQIQQNKPAYSEKRIEDMYRAFGKQKPLTAQQITANNQKENNLNSPLTDWNKLSVLDKIKMALTNPDKFLQMSQDASDEKDAQELQKNPNRDNDIFTGIRNSNNNTQSLVNNSKVLSSLKNSASNKFMQQASVGGIKTLFGDNTVNAPSTGSNFADKAAQFLGGVAAFGVNPGSVGGGMNGGSLSDSANILGNAAEKPIGKFTGKILEDAANKGLSPLSQKVLTKGLDYGGNALRSGLEFGGISAGQAALQGGSNKDILKSGLEGAGQGALFGTGFKAAGDLIPKGLSKLANLKGKEVKAETPTETIENDPLNTFKNNSESAALKIETPDENNKLKITLKNNKAKEPGNIIFPEVKPTDNLKPRGFSETVKNSPVTNPEVSKGMNFEYNPITNEDTVIQAQKIINADPIKAKEWVMSEEPSTATQNATAQLLIKQAQDEGRYGDAIDMVEKVAQKATKQGQAIQALSLWNKLTPEGMLRFAQRTVDKANLKLPEKQKIKLTEDTAKEITDSMKEIQKMPEGTEKNEATQVVLKKIADQVPAGFWKKVDTIQTMAQLLNPRTSIRNILGNAGMQVNENLSNTIGTPLDILTSKFTGKRTVGLPSIPTQLKGYAEGFKTGIRQVGKGIPEDSTQFDLPQEKIFKSKAMNEGQKILDYMLRVPDQASKKAIYDDSLRTQMKIAKVTTPTEEMIQAAENDAKYGTFQDDTALAKAFTTLKNKVLNGGKDFGAGSIILKYPKTPANIIMRAIDYSPAGFFKATYRLAEPLIKGGEFNQRAFVKDTSRALVGTGNLIGTGYLFTKLGIITGKSNDDTDTAAMQKQVGLGDYKLNLSALKRFVFSGFNTDKAKPQQGDKLINYDWFQPASIGLAIGANMADSKNKGITSFASNVADSLNSGLNTLMQQPLISGLTNALQQRDAGKIITSTLKGVPASVVPTIFKQVAQLIDNTSRSTYDTSWINQTANLAKTKIPGLTYTLQPKLDTFGHEQKAYENNNPFNVFLNPAFTSTYKTSPAAQLPFNIFQQTGSKTVMPRLADNYIMYKGQKLQLTPQEYTDLQKYIGNETEKEYNDYTKYNQGVSYDNQIKALQKLLNEINKEGRNRILKKRGLEVSK